MTLVFLRPVVLWLMGVQYYTVPLLITWCVVLEASYYSFLLEEWSAD